MTEGRPALEIRRMAVADLPAVEAIDSLSFFSPWPPNTYWYELIENERALCWVAEAAGAVAGMLVGWLVLDEFQIGTIAVHPDFRRRGIGRRLLEHVLREVIARGVQLVTLEVRAGNTAAQALYAAFGFRIVGERRRFYSDGEDALLMNLEIVESKEIMSIKQTLIEKLEDRTAQVAIMGLGYVGLPLAVVFADAGFEVTGIDPDARKVAILKTGKSYIQDVPDEDVQRHVAAGRLHATTDFSALRRMDAVSICVPTPLRKTGDPDLSFIVSASEELAKHLHPGMIVVLESTTYPGTTRELMLPTITGGNDLVAGKDFFLAFSPERVDPGRSDWTTINTPKVMGGITRDCSEVAACWYGKALQTIIPVSSAETAEMSKLLENTFRMVNIGLVNEMALMCGRLGIDVWEVIEAAATKPFGFMKFTPGPGLGGHCIPIDPLYLSWKLRSLNYTARFIELASEINTGMPRHVVRLVMDALNDHGKALKGSRVLVLGAAYKPDIDDLRESPALDVLGLLHEKGAVVEYHDPYIPSIHHDGLTFHSVPDVMAAVRLADCVAIVTNHSDYDYAAILESARLIVDTRNALKLAGDAHPKVVKL